MIYVYVGQTKNLNIAMVNISKILDYIYDLFLLDKKIEYKNILTNFLAIPEGSYNYKFISSEFDQADNVTIDTYILDSQIWPKNTDNIWHHKLKIYRPEIINYSTALIHTTGGYNYNLQNIECFTPPNEDLKFAKIANKTKSLVVELQNVPNQFLKFENEILKKEDEIIVYSYNKFLEDSTQNIYMPAHLPMAKSIIKAMDAIESIMVGHQTKIDHFIASGASKRGWATWLAAIGDKRISAIIPIVLDVLNFKDNIKHIFASYGGDGPIGLKDYSILMDRIETQEMKDLITIVDPFSYIGNSDYSDRLSIPKYIINASGDDVFVPDSSSFYFHELPGNNILRYLPNSSHDFDKDIVSDALLSYYNANLNSIALPNIDWNFDDNSINIFSSHQPIYAKLWSAKNPDFRDFRFNKYQYDNKISGDIKYIESDIYLNHQNNLPYILNIDLPEKDMNWQAAFVELGYNIGEEIFILSTGVNITKPFDNIL